MKKKIREEKENWVQYLKLIELKVANFHFIFEFIFNLEMT